jgi:hypothetical protein
MWAARAAKIRYQWKVGDGKKSEVLGRPLVNRTTPLLNFGMEGILNALLGELLTKN